VSAFLTPYLFVNQKKCIEQYVFHNLFTPPFLTKKISIFEIYANTNYEIMSLENKETRETKGFNGSRFREEVHSKAVRAGKRTYFFDVKATRRNEYYLTITESKKRTDSNGNSFYEKHKIFLYKEDFEKFADGLNDIIEYIAENQPMMTELEEPEEITAEYSNVEFEDLAR
jgi:hypothetical protein